MANRATRRNRRSSSGWAARYSRHRKAQPATTLTQNSASTAGAVNPVLSPVITPKISVASAAAPSSAPAISTRWASGSAFSGRTIAAAISAATPNTRLNQKMPRQFQPPTSAPPRTGPAASASPATAAHTPMARLRARSSV